MAKIRITKTFVFEMAHALLGYDGPCKHIHGHSYKLDVTILGEPIEDKGSVKLGMVMDFGDLKQIVRKAIVEPFDHSLVLHRNAVIEHDAEMFGRVIYVDYQPTSENMIVDFAEKLNSLLPTEVKLHSLRLYETATSYAEWFVADNT